MFLVFALLFLCADHLDHRMLHRLETWKRLEWHDTKSEHEDPRKKEAGKFHCVRGTVVRVDGQCLQ